MKVHHNVFAICVTFNAIYTLHSFGDLKTFNQKKYFRARSEWMKFKEYLEMMKIVEREGA